VNIVDEKNQHYKKLWIPMRLIASGWSGWPVFYLSMRKQHLIHVAPRSGLAANP
jgi:hypothetical protein